MQSSVLSHRPRSCWQVTWAVWHALLLREAMGRMFSSRTSLVWMFLEPVLSLGFMVLMFTVVRLRTVAGIDTVLWLLGGMLSFFVFRRTSAQGANAIGANRALFAYQQIKPVDTVLVRCSLELILMCIVATLVLAGAALLGVQVGWDNPLMVLGGVVGLWLLGVGWALAVSVATELIPELGYLLGLVMAPMMFMSGVIFPISAIPMPWRGWVLYNPLAHGIEAVRAGTSHFYHAVPELDLGYMYACALVLLWLGLLLQRAFKDRLIAQ